MTENKTPPPVAHLWVKPLEWKAVTEGFGHGRMHYGTGAFGHWYGVKREKAGLWSCVHHVGGTPVYLPPQVSLDEAKSAAQADYDERLRAALDTLPGGFVLVPVRMSAAMINAWSGGLTVSSDETAYRTSFQDAWTRVLAVVDAPPPKSSVDTP